MVGPVEVVAPGPGCALDGGADGVVAEAVGLAVADAEGLEDALGCVDAPGCGDTLDCGAAVARRVAVSCWVAGSLTDSRSVCCWQAGSWGVVSAHAGSATRRSRLPNPPPTADANPE